MQSAALLAARNAGREVFPVLQVSWASRGLSLGDAVYAPHGRHTDVGGVTGITRTGGWAPIPYGSGIEKGELRAVETSVDIVDVEQTLIRMLDAYDPRGSACTISSASPGLVSEDWEPFFVGVVSDWQADGLHTRVLMKTDDTVLRTPVPSSLFNRTEWSAAYDSTIFGTHMPLVIGIHDSYKITARGMVAAVNIRYDKDYGYWWLASVGHMVEIRRLYYDGEPQDDGGWTVRRMISGGNRLTIIDINEGYQPEEGVVVSFDCEGVDSDGLEVGTAITNPIIIARVLLEEYVYRTPPLNGFRGDHSIIDDTSWNAVAAYLTARGYDAALRFGGDQNEQSAAAVIQSLLDSHKWLRIWWTPLGKLALFVIDHDDVDPDGTAWLDVAAHHRGGMGPYAPGDRREVYTHINMPFLRSAAEQKFLSGYEAQDVAALDEKVVLTIENPWSQARFDLE